MWTILITSLHHLWRKGRICRIRLIILAKLVTSAVREAFVRSTTLAKKVVSVILLVYEWRDHSSMKP